MSKINSVSTLCAHEIIGEVKSFVGWLMKELERHEEGKKSRFDWHKNPKELIDELALTFIGGFLDRNFDIFIPREELISALNDLSCTDCKDEAQL